MRPRAPPGARGKVCNEIRKRFGVPVERLTFVRNFMLQPKADHFREAAELMATLGVGVYLLTDLEDTSMSRAKRLRS